MRSNKVYEIQKSPYAETDNPAGLNGFAFLEFAAPDPTVLFKDFTHLGFSKVAQHKDRDITLWQQGEIQFVVNNDPQSHAKAFAKLHGPSVTAMGFRVKDQNAAFKHVTKLGAEPFAKQEGPGLLDVPVIYGIGGSLIYFMDDLNWNLLNFKEFEKTSSAENNDAGLKYLDHVTHNVFKGHMNAWADFYEHLFNFREIRYFDIQGKQTGLLSRAMTSPCHKIRIPLNESKDDKSQIQEYLDSYKGEGIQHIALGAGNIYTSVETMRANKVQFLEVPDTYYEMLDTRVPDHKEDKPRLQKNKILVDGNPTKGQGLLLQLFTENMLGPIFFEIIQRKGNEGFGEGNFQALFDAIERDQMKRGVL